MVLMCLMTINVLWQVFSRYILGNPSPFTEELARYLMIWLGLFGAAFVSGRDAHVAINILPNRCSTKAQRQLKVVVTIFIISFALFAMVIGGARLVYITWHLNQNSPALGIPLALVYSVIPISGILIIFYKTVSYLKPPQ